MGPIAWIIFGGIAGWVASQLAGRGAQHGCLFNVIVGIVGAIIGGAVMQLFTGDPFTFRAFSLSSFVVAVLGSLILLAIANKMQQKR
ncbi:GlsB/YeaQ/YmgE family stress response membrane protein [Candidatus Oscillochloris fontis]|uniref:GlsB/YeaQ/YmgE family stress response membrane protein n=1 Tax=Candidatus Oscillochloris fontis TaxID=2496868 RepID=UPI00101D5CF4|nr:GlsB/YeaQ/YmgE family stress response membrane protein [Candidatus Oscillochloris fontis]